MKPAASACPDASLIEPTLFARFTPSVPEPVPVLAVTVQAVADDVLAGVTSMSPKPVRPAAATSAKFAALTPVTGSLKRTSHVTVPGAVGVGVPGWCAAAARGGHERGQAGGGGVRVRRKGGL